MNYNIEQQNSLFSSITAKKSTVSLNNQNLKYRLLIYFINYNSVLKPGKKGTSCIRHASLTTFTMTCVRTAILTTFIIARIRPASLTTFIIARVRPPDLYLL